MTAPELHDNVLTTLGSDGKRIWLKPRLSKGKFYTARLLVGWALILVFFLLPWVKINGHPAILLDIVHRKFHLFGYTFLPTDTILLALFMVGLFVAIFLFTAILGRLWCGWACPQTVYLEFLYRPLERLFDGTIGKGGTPARHAGDWRKVAYFIAALLVTLIPAHTFLAYFVGVEALQTWVTGSPLKHPTAFVVMAATTFLMMFDFYYFREQLCILACPYGRFQSVLLDRNSLIVSYDHRRGEPRGRRVSLKVAEGEAAPAAAQGDCVDCHLCVATCPTGIDIRNGLQMECVNCTQCIDACDAVMKKIGKATGLIRYSSQAAIDGAKPRLLRPRIIFYPLILVIIATLWLTLFAGKGTADVIAMRGTGKPFVVTPGGEVANTLQVKVTNRGEAAADYAVEIIDHPGIRLLSSSNPMHVAAGASRTEPFTVMIPAGSFTHGNCDVTLRISDGKGFTRDIRYRLLGP